MSIIPARLFPFSSRVVFFVGLFLAANTSALAAEKGFPDLTRAMLESPRYLETLRIEVRERMRVLHADLAETDDDDDRDDIDDVIEILGYLERKLEAAARRSTDTSVLLRANTDARRVLDSLVDRESLEDNGLPPWNELFRHTVLGTLFGHGIPLVPERLRDEPLGVEKAALESWYLFDPARGEFLSVDELSRLTPRQVAHLDIDPEHPAWLTHAALESSRDTRGRTFERDIARGVTRHLRTDGDIEPENAYDLHSARKVLILDEVYLSGTSPKAETEDAHGLEWKVKWGDEVAVEPVVSRLYLLAGGRFTDLTYANPPGRDGLVLVLNEKGAVETDEEDGDERHAETVEQLAAALEDFYGFDLRPYILAHGTITPRNRDDILRHLPRDAEAEYDPSDLVGRQWVTFRETGVELRPQGYVRRCDGAALHDDIARNDRAWRGSYLFDLWIANRDAKYDNQKMFFFRGGDGEGGEQVVDHAAGHHDLGLSLGGLLSAGRVNRFRDGERFTGRSFGKLRFKAPMIFKPEAWEAASWADGKWMARHIASIDEPRIREAIASSLWPEFVQEALVYRLVTRRNRIAEMFGEEDRLDGSEPDAPHLVVPLGTTAEIEAAEKRFGLVPGTLARELARRRTGRFYRETLLRNGTIASAERSSIVRLLVEQRYASGLARRYQRRSDSGPLE